MIAARSLFLQFLGGRHIHSQFLNRVYLHISLVGLAAVVSSLISTRYFGYLPEPTSVTTLGYSTLATLSQMSLLAMISGLCTVPLVFIPSLAARRVIYGVVFSLGIFFLFIDTVVFAQYRFHINSIVLKLVTSGDVVNFSLTTWLIAILAIVALFLSVFILVKWLNRRSVEGKKRLAKVFFIAALASTLATHAIHIWASAYGHTSITITSRYLPLFQPATANSFLEKHGLVDAELQNRKKIIGQKQGSSVNYPRQALQTEPLSSPKNIMLVVIDSWRADSFSESLNPVVANLSQTGVVLENHYSSGNSTRAGIFGLFYGLPAPYWHAFFANRQAPLLMQRLQELDYELGIFASAKLTQPEFDKTVFADVANLRVRSQGGTPAIRDRNLTDDWISWYKEKRNKDMPAFSFLFYDAPHGYDFPKDYPHRFEPMLDSLNYLELDDDFDPEPLFNRYRTSVHFTDSLIGEVLTVLEQQDDLQDTLIIITGDHGQEFNDNRQGFWGHNSNFTDAQVKVPLILHGPGVANAGKWRDSGDLSIHEDIAPTLLANYLGVMNPLEDYSTGQDLLQPPVARSWRMAAMYSGYAIIQADSIMEVGPSGQHSVYDRHNRLLDDAGFNLEVVKQALSTLRQFSR